MPHVINGLPVHVLLIHGVVVLIPVSALLLIAQAWSPAARRWAGIGGPLLCLMALIAVPITTNSGQWLRDQLPRTPLIKRHADLGGQLLPWVAAMFVLSVAVFLLARRTAEADKPIVLDRPSSGSAKVQLLVAVLATVVACGSVVQTIRIGDSGAQAVWKGTVK
jgi:hypothetical protein